MALHNCNDVKHGSDVTHFNCPPVCAKQITFGSLLLLRLTLSALRDIHRRYLLWYVGAAGQCIQGRVVGRQIQGREQLNNTTHHASFSHDTIGITNQG